MSEDTETPSQESPDSEAPSVAPLEVKVTNEPVKDTKWNDDKDDLEYEEIILTKEDMDI